MRGFETLAIQYLVYNSRKKVLLFLQTTEHKSKAESRQISCYAVISIQMYPNQMQGDRGITITSVLQNLLNNKQ